MRIRFSLFITIAILFSVVAISCKTKKGAGSANVRTLSMKTPGMYMFSFAGKTTPDAVITTRELAVVDKVKILSKGKEVQNVTLKFKMKIIRAEADAGSAMNDGTELSSEVKDLLKSAVAGDKISFESIRIAAQGGEEVIYPPMSFVVK